MATTEQVCDQFNSHLFVCFFCVLFQIGGEWLLLPSSTKFAPSIRFVVFCLFIIIITHHTQKVERARSRDWIISHLFIEMLFFFDVPLNKVCVCSLFPTWLPVYYNQPKRSGKKQQHQARRRSSWNFNILSWETALHERSSNKCTTNDLKVLDVRARTHSR